MAAAGSASCCGQGVQAAEKEGGPSVSPEACVHTELRIVLLGRVWTGKSSAGNTILGREEFDTRRLTEECEKRQGEVAGRLVSVVDTPGWYSLQGTADWVKKEIVRSVSLCPPGPHSFLLTIPLAPFTEPDRKAVEEHLGLLGDRVWRHTLVLFTWGDGKGGTALEQAIKRGGEDLQRLVEKCGNRVHVLRNNDTGDRGQVTELLEKIEAMVAGSPDAFFLGSDRGITQEEQEKKWRDREGGREEASDGNEKIAKRAVKEETQEKKPKLPVRKKNSIEHPLNLSRSQGRDPLGEREAPAETEELKDGMGNIMKDPELEKEKEET